MHTCVASSIDLIFSCPACNQNSQLQFHDPSSGIYKVTCCVCNTITHIKLDTSDTSGISFQILENYNSPKIQTDFKPTNKDDQHFIDNNHINKKDLHSDDSEKNKIFKIIWENIHKQKQKLNTEFVTRYFHSNLYKIILPGVLILLSFIIPFAFFFYGVYEVKYSLRKEISILYKNNPTKVLSADGELISEIFQKKVSNLKLSEYPEQLQNIILSVEDYRFYSHPGIDLPATIRAVGKNLFSFGYKQGASTITQQLARILLDDRRKSLGRKWKEAQTAVALEMELSKKEILEAYCNLVYLGHGAFGFGEASKFYFGKEPSTLSKQEMVLLSSLASSPTKYSPLKNPELSKSRIKNISGKLIERNAISPSEIENLYSLYQSFTLNSDSTVYNTRYDISPYVTEHVRETLIHLDPKSNIYETGGYVVKTSILKSVQKELGILVSEYLADLENKKIVKKVRLHNSSEENIKKYPAENLQAAVIGIDPKTGNVLFLHGGDHFVSQNQFNRAIQMRRQTGSSIKPILYSGGVEMGEIYPGMKILDAPVIYRGMKGKPFWAPDNVGLTYDGEISVREALLKSKNTAAVQIADKMGPQGVESIFTKFLFPDEKEKNKRYRSDLSIALGSLELSPLEMASAFTAFANDGSIIRPKLIQDIKTSSNQSINFKRIDEFSLNVPEIRKAISSDVAEVMVSMMRGSANASGVRHQGINSEIAGKTGTTNDFKDAWFIGTTPTVTMAVWIGYDDPAYGMGSRGMGASVAAPLWGKIIKLVESKKIFPKEKFHFSNRASYKTVCKDSGDLATESCSHKISEIFPKTTKHLKTCTLKHNRTIKREILRNTF